VTRHFYSAIAEGNACQAVLLPLGILRFSVASVEPQKGAKVAKLAMPAHAPRQREILDSVVKQLPSNLMSLAADFYHYFWPAWARARLAAEATQADARGDSTAGSQRRQRCNR
jgi:hypothetical protein